MVKKKVVAKGKNYMKLIRIKKNQNNSAPSSQISMYCMAFFQKGAIKHFYNWGNGQLFLGAMYMPSLPYFQWFCSGER